MSSYKKKKKKKRIERKKEKNTGVFCMSDSEFDSFMEQSNTIPKYEAQQHVLTLYMATHIITFLYS